MIAYFCKICVAIYAFIAGYGLCRSAEGKKADTIKDALIRDYRYAFEHLKGLLLKVLLVFIVFAPIGYILGRFKVESIIELALCSIGIDNRINGEWWYIKTYIAMLIIFPIISVIFVDSGAIKTIRLHHRAALLFLGTVVILIMAPFVSETYMIVFLEGYVVARFRIYELLSQFVKSKLTVGMLLLIGTFLFRTIVSTGAASNKVDLIIISAFIYAVCLITDHTPKLASFFSMIGNFSVFIWLTHTFYCYYYFKRYFVASRVSTIIFLQTLIVSLISAVVFVKAEKVIKKVWFKKV